MNLIVDNWQWNSDFNNEMEDKTMTDEKRKYCMETIIPNIRKNGVSLEELSEEIDYRDRNGILEPREGFDDRIQGSNRH